MNEIPYPERVPYPRGWFQVGYSSDLTPGQVEPIRYFDQELVLFRTDAGVPHVLQCFLCAPRGPSRLRRHGA
jgi:phenylpropionate dioxygenase-like ring-hydroxylating dioxygenase large terminal subunit